jgi:DNA-binding NarL/FixJ family response regulator
MADTTVGLVDDDPMIRSLLRPLLAGQPGILPVADFPDGESAVEYASAHHVDVYLVDLAMKGMNGYATTVQLLNASPGSAVVILSAVVDAEESDARAAGAYTFLSKTASPENVAEVIRAAHESRVRDGDWAEGAGHQLSGGLSAQEQAVLAHLGEGMSNRQIARAMGLSVPTVKHHMHSVMEKLDAGSRLEAVTKAHRIGLISR